MALNPALLTTIVGEAVVLDRVRQEPAVIKAWGEALTDFRTAIGSAGRAISETGNAYSRHKYGRGGAPAPVRA